MGKVYAYRLQDYVYTLIKDDVGLELATIWTSGGSTATT